MGLFDDQSFLQKANAAKEHDLKYFNNSREGTGSVEPVDPIDVKKQRIAALPEVNPLRSYVQPDGGSKYSDEFKPGSDYWEAIGERQSPMARWANAVPRLLGSVATKTVQQIGFGAGLIGIDNEGSIGTDWISEAADNALAQYGKGWEESLKEKFPIYKTRNYTEGNAFQNLWSASWWTDDFVDGLAFMISAFGPGIAMSGLGAGRAVARAVATANTFGQAATKLPAIAGGVDWLATTALSSAAESMFEARDARDATFENLINKTNPETGEPYTVEQAKIIAANNAANVFQSNMAILFVSNGLEAEWLLRGLGLKKGAKVLTDKLENKVSGEIARKPLTKFEQVMAKASVRIPKLALRGAAWEGFYEENIQQSIQDLNHSNRTQSDRKTMQGIRDIPEEIGLMFTDLDSDERQKAIMSGAILGMIGSTIAGERQHRRQEKVLNQVIDLGTKLNKGFITPDIYATVKSPETKYYIRDGLYYTKTGNENETEISIDDYKAAAMQHGAIKKDTDATPKEFSYKPPDVIDHQTVDNKKLANLFATVDKQGILRDIIGNQSVKTAKDRHVDNIIKDAMFTEWLMGHLMLENYDGAMDQLDKWAGAKPSDLSSLGYVPQGEEFDLKESIKHYKTLAPRIKDVFEAQHQGFIKPRNVSKELYDNFIEHKTKLASTIFAAETERNTLKKELSSLVSSDPEYHSVKQEIDDLVYQLDAKDKYIENAIQNEYGEDIAKFDALVKDRKDTAALILKKKEELNETLEVKVPLDLAPINMVGSINELQAKDIGIRLGHIENALKTMKDEWKSLSDPYKGINNYRKIRDANPRFTGKLKITAETNLQSLKRYLDSYFRRAEIKRSLDRNKSLILSEYIADRIAAGHSMIDIGLDMEEVYQNKYMLVPKDYKTVMDGLQEYVDRFENHPFNTSEELGKKTTVDGAIYSLNNLPGDSYAGIEYEDLAKEIRNYEHLKELADTASDIMGIIKSREDFLINRNLSTDPSSVKRSIINEEYLGIALKGMQDIQKTKQSKDPNIVARDIETLEGLQNLIPKLGITGTEVSILSEDFPQYKAPMTIEAEVNAYLTEYRKLKEVNDARLKEERIVQKGAVDHYVESVVRVLDIKNPDSIAGKALANSKAKTNVEEELKKELDLASVDILVDGIRYSTDNKQDTIAALEKRKDELKDEYVVAFREFIDRIPAQLISMMQTLSKSSILNNFMQIIQILKASKILPADDILIKDFTKFKDYAKHIRKIDESIQDEESKAKRKALINIVADIASLENVIRELKSEYTLRKKYSELNAVNINVDPEKGIMPSSEEQLMAISDVVDFIEEEVQGTNGNIMIQSGFTGTGKTHLILKWVLGMLKHRKWQDDEIIVTASLEEANKVINGVAGRQNKDLVNVGDVVSKITEKTKLVIIDEVNAMTFKEFNEMMRNLSAYNNAHPGVNVKFLLLGDPKQISRRASIKEKIVSLLDQYSPGDSIDMGLIRRSRQLISPYRSPIESQNSFFDRFNDETRDLSTENIKVESNVNNPYENDIELEGVFPSKGDFITNVKSLLKARGSLSSIPDKGMVYRDGRTRAVITNTENIGAYTNQLSGFNVEVVDIYRAAGRTFDEVYIDIKKEPNMHQEDYNKMIYTAGRGRWFSLVANFNLEHFKNDNIKNDKAIQDAVIANNKKVADRMITKVREYLADVHKTTLDDAVTVKRGPKAPPAPTATTTDQEAEQTEQETEAPPEDLFVPDEQEPTEEDEIGMSEEDLSGVTSITTQETKPSGEEYEDDTTDTRQFTRESNAKIGKHMLNIPERRLNGRHKPKKGAKVYYVKEEFQYGQNHTKAGQKGYRIGVYAGYEKDPIGRTGRRDYYFLGVYTGNEILPDGYEAEAIGLRKVAKGEQGGIYDNVPIITDKIYQDKHVISMLDLENSPSVVLTGELDAMYNAFFNYKYVIDGIQIMNDVSPEALADKFAKMKSLKITDGMIVSKLIVNSVGIRNRMLDDYFTVDGKPLYHQGNAMKGSDLFGMMDYDVLNDPKNSGKPMLLVSFYNAETKKWWSTYEFLRPRKLRYDDADAVTVRDWNENSKALEANLQAAFGVEIKNGVGKAYRNILYAIKSIHDKYNTKTGVDISAIEANHFSFISKTLSEIGVMMSSAEVKNLLFQPRAAGANSSGTVFYNNLYEHILDVISGVIVKYNGQNYPGVAQQAFNNIAASNLVGNGALLRREKMVEDSKVNGVWNHIIEGRSLVGLEGKPDARKKKDITQAVYERDLKYNLKVHGTLTKEDVARLKQEAIEKDRPLTSEDIDGLVGDEAFNEQGDSVSNGELGLFYNIKQEKHEDEISLEDVHSTLQHIEPPKTIVTLPQRTQTQQPKQSKQPTATPQVPQAPQAPTPQQKKAFDEKLNEKIKEVLEDLYPEIELEYTNEPIKEDPNAFNQRAERLSLNESLMNFLSKLNINVQTVDDIKTLTGYDAMSTTDLLYKMILIKNGNESELVRETAYVAYSLLGKKGKIRTDLIEGIKGLPNYEKIKADYKKKAPDLNDYTIDELIAVDYLADAIRNNYELPKESYINRDAEYWTITGNSKLEKRLKYILGTIKKMVKRMLDIRLTPEETQSILDDIANDVLTMSFKKFAPELTKKEQQANYDKTIAKDPTAEKIIKDFQDVGLVLTGSLSLRRQGTLYRTEDEDLHDLDFSAPYSSLNERDIRLISAISRESEILNSNKLLKAFRMSVDASPLKNLSIIQAIKEKYPTYKPDKVWKGANETYTVTGTINIQGTKYAIDIFIVDDESLDSREKKFQDWEPIFKAKIQMGRPKDIKDFVNYVPYSQAEERYSQDPGFRHFTFNNIVNQRNEQGAIIGQANVRALKVLIDSARQKQDTLPHEYAHHYIAWYRNTPIVQEAIKKWGSEEALVQAIGEQVVKQEGEAWDWWTKFSQWIMDKIRSLSALNKEQLRNILTDAFLTREDLRIDTVSGARMERKQLKNEVVISGVKVPVSFLNEMKQLIETDHGGVGDVDDRIAEYIDVNKVEESFLQTVADHDLSSLAIQWLHNNKVMANAIEEAAYDITALTYINNLLQEGEIYEYIDKQQTSLEFPAESYKPERKATTGVDTKPTESLLEEPVREFNKRFDKFVLKHGKGYFKYQSWKSFPQTDEGRSRYLKVLYAIDAFITSSELGKEKTASHDYLLAHPEDVDAVYVEHQDWTLISKEMHKFFKEADLDLKLMDTVNKIIC